MFNLLTCPINKLAGVNLCLPLRLVKQLIINIKSYSFYNQHKVILILPFCRTFQPVNQML